MAASTDTSDTQRLSNEARNLRWLLRNFVEEVPGVNSVAVVPADGLMLLSSDTTGSTTASAEAGADGSGRPGGGNGSSGSVADLATVVSGIASLTEGAARLMDGGRVQQTAVTMEEGSVFVMSISDGSLLGVHAVADCDMSVVAYHMALFVGRAGHVLTPALCSELRRATGRCAADFLALLQQVAAAFPHAPAVVVICDNDSIHHARAVRDFITAHPGVHLWYGARYSPHDNPTERIWAAVKAFLANTAVSWPGRRRQLHAFFRTRSPDQLLTTAAPWTSPWFPASYRQKLWKRA